MNQNKYILDTLTRLMGVYQMMKVRCDDDKILFYNKKHLGMDGQWRRNPLRFIFWALRHGYGKGLEIDRINNKKGYMGSNCHFVNHSANMSNRGPEPFTGKTIVGGGVLPLNVFQNKKPTGISIYKPFKVCFSRCGVRYYIGTYKTIKAAVRARDKALRKYGKSKGQIDKHRNGV